MTSKTTTKNIARQLTRDTEAPYQSCLTAAAALSHLVRAAGSDTVARAVATALRDEAKEPAWDHDNFGTFTANLSQSPHLKDAAGFGHGADKTLRVTGEQALFKQDGDGHVTVILPMETTAGDMPGPGADAGIFLQVRLGGTLTLPAPHILVPMLDVLRAVHTPQPDGSAQLRYSQTSPLHIDFPPSPSPTPESLTHTGLEPRVVDAAGWAWDIFMTSVAGEEAATGRVSAPVPLPAGLFDWADDFSDPGSRMRIALTGNRTFSRSGRVRRWWGVFTLGHTTVWVGSPIR
jgi:hypothetical protein